MKREELLRQLDHEVDDLKSRLDAVDRNLRQVKEEESQKVPKWAKRINEGDPRVRLGHWYRVLQASKGNCGLKIRDEDGGIWQSAFPVENNLWELCYDDNSPVEETKTPKWARTLNGSHNPFVIKNGKWYRIRNFNGKSFEFTGDGGNYVYCLVKGCAHLNGGSWDFCYDDTPPEEKKQDDPAEILLERANKHWSASVPGYKILYSRGNIDSDDYVAILTDGTGGNNTFLLVGKEVLKKMRDGVCFIGCI